MNAGSQCLERERDEAIASASSVVLSNRTRNMGDEGRGVDKARGMRETGKEDIRFSGAFWNFLYSRSSY